MTILVIGGAGFIGSAIGLHLHSMGYEVAGADIRSQSDSVFPFHLVDGSLGNWERLFASGSFDFCINAAGSSNVNDSLLNPNIDFSLNVKDTAVILEAIRLSGNLNCHYIHISSAAVYGNPGKLPVKEGDPCNPVSPYGWNKLMAEELCREYHFLYGLPVFIVRPFSVYGPGLKKQLFWDIYTRFKNNPRHVELWGTGLETRDFIHIDDLVHCFECLLRNSGSQAGIYNVGNGEMITIKEASSLFLKHLDQNAIVSFNGLEHAGNPRNWQADISAIRALGYVPAVTFEKGMEDLAAWALSQG